MLISLILQFYTKFFVSFSKGLQLAFKSFSTKSLFSLKLNALRFIWKLSSNYTNFWYTSRFSYSYSKFYIDIQILALIVKVSFWHEKFPSREIDLNPT